MAIHGPIPILLIQVISLKLMEAKDNITGADSLTHSGEIYQLQALKKN
ncbi:MAG: hypothetical protein OQK12_00800 [Motiliproteus sp.]|nr:hypothetical protein [Motiliproteus sp.]